MSKLDFIHILGLGNLNSGASLGSKWLKGTGALTESKTPVDGSVIAQIQNASLEDYEKVMACAQNSFREWSRVPAPHRGEIIRQIGNSVREAKDDLGKLISWEMGKIYRKVLEKYKK